MLSALVQTLFFASVFTVDTVDQREKICIEVLARFSRDNSTEPAPRRAAKMLNSFVEGLNRHQLQVSLPKKNNSPSERRLRDFLYMYDSHQDFIDNLSLEVKNVMNAQGQSSGDMINQQASDFRSKTWRLKLSTIRDSNELKLYTAIHNRAQSDSISSEKYNSDVIALVEYLQANRRQRSILELQSFFEFLERQHRLLRWLEPKNPEEYLLIQDLFSLLYVKPTALDDLPPEKKILVPEPAVLLASIFNREVELRLVEKKELKGKVGLFNSKKHLAKYLARYKADPLFLQNLSPAAREFVE